MKRSVLQQTPALMLLLGLLSGSSLLRAETMAPPSALASAADAAETAAKPSTATSASALAASAAPSASATPMAAPATAASSKKKAAKSKRGAKAQVAEKQAQPAEAATDAVQPPDVATATVVAAATATNQATSPAASASAAAKAQPSSLLDVYQLALERDMQYAAARAALEAAKTLPQQVGGQFLPQISAHGSLGKNETEQTTLRTRRPLTRTFDYKARTASIRLAMPIFRPQLWAEYARSRAELRLAQAEFENATQELILRVSQAYFDTLLAQDVVALAQAQTQAMSAHVQRARRYFETGVGTITDVEDSQARHESAMAQEITAKNTFDLRKNILQNITGQEHHALRSVSKGLRAQSPKLDEMEGLVQTAMQGNAAVRAAQARYDVSDKEVMRARSGHLPVLDLVASSSRERSPGYTTINEKLKHKSVALQLTIPIFSGGSTQGRVRQTIALRDKASSELEHARQITSLGLREQFLNLSAAVARIQAAQQQVKAQDLILQSASKGKELGVRTHVEVLDAQQALFAAQRDLAQARHDYLLTQLKLRKFTGLLDSEDVQKADDWLSR
ncbi:MAG: TolC family outer membrane protein [Brachymonas sp.]|nr:TolC family outer membrane protein [Brachymonas sp.]